ncbi:ABC transporter permease [Candidatus Geothermarchaeota archaeon]|nr:MAG: ABC transporter permease [Candidatus Geothermarchaeota archaeon]
MIETLLTTSFWITVLAMTLRMATPLIFGSIGEALAERSGILNLGIEGMMLMGASIGFLMAYKTGNLWLAVLAAGLIGALMGLLMAFLSETIGAPQHVTGIGITILGSGLSFYLYRINVPTPGGVPPTISPFKEIKIPFLSDVPFIGQVLFSQHLLVYLALILIPISAFILYKTHIGLMIRAVGENPRAADVTGINVALIRYICTCSAGFLAGIAGSWLSLAQSNMFLPGMTMGRGWVCIALVVFGHWDPIRILGAALLFGFIDAFQLSLQAAGFKIPYHLLLATPYVMTIIVLALVARKAEYPAAMLKPYRREE